MASFTNDIGGDLVTISNDTVVVVYEGNPSGIEGGLGPVGSAAAAVKAIEQAGGRAVRAVAAGQVKAGAKVFVPNDVPDGTWWPCTRTNSPTKEPVTIGGWYECEDGTWVEFAWVSGALVERARASEPRRSALTDSDGFRA